MEVKSLYSTFNECATDGKLDRPAFKKAIGYLPFSLSCHSSNDRCRALTCFFASLLSFLYFNSKLEEAGLKKLDDTPFPDRCVCHVCGGVPCVCGGVVCADRRVCLLLLFQDV